MSQDSSNSTDFVGNGQDGDPKKQSDNDLLSYLTKLNVVSRFQPAPETTIDLDCQDTLVDQRRQSTKVLSWNIAKNNQDDGWAQDFLAIVEQYQPDKIFLQEVRLCAEQRSLPELGNMGWSFAPNFIDTYENTYSGVLIATKADRLSSQSLITGHTEPIINTPKVSLFAEYSRDDLSENLLAVNTHLINFVDLSKFAAQLQSLEAVLTAHDGDIIFYFLVFLKLIS